MGSLICTARPHELGLWLSSGPMASHSRSCPPQACSASSTPREPQFPGVPLPKGPHLIEIPYIKESSGFLGQSSLKKILPQWITYLRGPPLNPLSFPIAPVGRPRPVLAGLIALLQDTRATENGHFLPSVPPHGLPACSLQMGGCLPKLATAKPNNNLHPV